jgi:peptidoglycan/LPS O-acetylase OafA/YrhL
VEAEPNAKTARLAGIEGFRAIAAMSVLVYHVYYYAAPDGRAVDLGVFTKIVDNFRAGVTLFFVLSGFLLYRVFVGAALRGRSMPSVRRYLRNRALRILPAYWVILIAVALVFQSELLTAPLMLTANLLLLQNYVPSYLAGGEEGLGIVPAWSLVVEVSFYLLVPILGYIAVRLASRRGLGTVAALVPVAAMLAVGIAAKAITRAMEPSDALAIWNHALPTHADWFAAGMALAVARVLHEDGRLELRRTWVAVGTLGATAFAVLSAKLYYQGTLSGLEQQTANAILFAVALGFVVLSSPQARAVRWLSWRPVVFLGLASYSLFLVHDPMVRGFRDWGLTFGGTSGFALNLLIIAAISVVVASASYLYVERPALARKQGWQVGDRAGLGSNAPPPVAAPATSPVPLADAHRP